MRHAREDLGLKFFVEEHGIPEVFKPGHRKRLLALAAQQDPVAIAALEEDDAADEEVDVEEI